MHARSMIRRLALIGIFAVASTAGAVTTSTLAPSPAGAQCAPPAEAGNWHNIDPNTRSITRTEVSLRTCGDHVICDELGRCSGGITTFNLHLWGKCHPSDCDWGVTSASQRTDGWIVGTYNFGFKVSTVWVKTYSYYGLTYLRVWVYNDFSAADGRTDYVSDEWFLR